MRAVIVAGLVAMLCACGAQTSETPAGSAGSSASSSPADLGCEGPRQPSVGTDAQQAAVLAVAQKVDAIVSSSAAGSGGYAGMYVTTGETRLDVFWKGAPPKALTDLAAPGVTVGIHPAAYTEPEMQAAVSKAIRVSDGTLSVVVAGPCVTGSGIHVEVTTKSSGQPPATIPEAFRARVRALVGTMPVDFASTGQPVGA